MGSQYIVNAYNIHKKLLLISNPANSLAEAMASIIDGTFTYRCKPRFFDVRKVMVGGALAYYDQSLLDVLQLIGRI